MFQTYVAGVSVVLDVCCKCFIWMLQKEIWCYTCCNRTHLLQLLGRHACAWEAEGNGGRGTGSPEHVKRELLGHCACTG
jgi:hypothetical protein